MEILSTLTKTYKTKYQLWLEGKVIYVLDHIEIGDGGHDPGTGDPLPVDQESTSLNNPTHSWDTSILEALDTNHPPWIRISWKLPMGDDLSYSEIGVFFKTVWEDGETSNDVWLGWVAHLPLQHKTAGMGTVLHTFLKT